MTKIQEPFELMEFLVYGIREPVSDEAHVIDLWKRDLPADLRDLDLYSAPRALEYFSKRFAELETYGTHRNYLAMLLGLEHTPPSPGNVSVYHGGDCRCCKE